MLYTKDTHESNLDPTTEELTLVGEAIHKTTVNRQCDQCSDRSTGKGGASSSGRGSGKASSGVGGDT